MWSSKSWKFLAFSLLSLFLLPAFTLAQHYKQTNLVSDVPGMAPVTDPNLINPWGLSRSNGSPWWISDNNSGFTSLYTGAGVSVPINGTGTVIIPPPKNAPPGTTATPTGTVFNGSPDFVLPNGNPARFIFATEDGTISAWNGGPSAVLMADNSDNGSPNGAVYKGATTADINGKRFLYVTNFRRARVEVYDTTFTSVWVTTLLKPREFLTASHRSMFRISVAPFSLPMPSRIPQDTMTSLATASVSFFSSRHREGLSATSSMARG
jgi:uncharacterized protein (TIGR03118 family)